MEEIKMNFDMWEIISEIYEPVMKLKAAHDKYPEVFSGVLQIFFGELGTTFIEGPAIAPYKFKVTPEGKWIDRTERRLNISDRRTE